MDAPTISVLGIMGVSLVIGIGMVAYARGGAEHTETIKMTPKKIEELRKLRGL